MHKRGIHTITSNLVADRLEGFMDASMSMSKTSSSVHRDRRGVHGDVRISAGSGYLEGAHGRDHGRDHARNH